MLSILGCKNGRADYRLKDIHCRKELGVGDRTHERNHTTQAVAKDVAGRADDTQRAECHHDVLGKKLERQ